MQCPRCHSSRVYPSRPRTIRERVRQKLSKRRPYRCHACNWRAWRDMEVGIEGDDVKPEDLRTGRPPAPLSQKDVDQLDPA
jgi:hypothetical protein